MHILLIEPDRLEAAILVAALEREGHTVAHAVSAQGAIYAADQKQPDVAVLELQLPRHNGVEFLYEFRSYPEWLGVPIVLHTFVPLRELAQLDTLRAELGVVRTLYKPATNLSQLCAAVQKLALVTP
jgi:CheY-like chemotaxis protein